MAEQRRRLEEEAAAERQQQESEADASAARRAAWEQAQRAMATREATRAAERAAAAERTAAAWLQEAKERIAGGRIARAVRRYVMQLCERSSRRPQLSPSLNPDDVAVARAHGPQRGIQAQHALRLAGRAGVVNAFQSLPLSPRCIL